MQEDSGGQQADHRREHRVGKRSELATAPSGTNEGGEHARKDDTECDHSDEACFARYLEVEVVGLAIFPPRAAMRSP